MPDSAQYSSLHDYLDVLMQNKESEHIEFKHGKGGFPSKSFWESYSSFANTDGGVIIIGVKEKNSNFYPEGLSREDIDKYEKIFWDEVNNPKHVSCSLTKNDDVIKGNYNGNHFIMFFIPRANRENKPVYIGQNIYTGTFKRDSTGDYLCPRWEISTMVAEQKHKLALDNEIFEGFSFEEDIDHESWRAFRQLFSNLKSSHPWASDDDISLLKHLKGYRKDRESGKEGLTLSGILMFGKNDTISEILPQFMIDYREYTPGNERWSDRIYNDGTWEANLFQAYRKILPKLQSFLPTPFKLLGNTRIDETNAHKALREAFVNFCVHALYQSTAKLTIFKYPTEIIFSNPGSMLVSKEQFYEGSESVCRNPSLQTMFSLIGAAEKAGSGSDTIVQGWKEANYRLPVITEKTRPNKVELIMPLESILSNDVKTKLVEVYGKDVLLLEATKLKILAATISADNISNSLLQHIIDLHPSDITDLLKTLCGEEYLVAHGIGRGTTYAINYNREKLENEKTPQSHTGATDEKELGGLFAIRYDNSHDTSNATSNTTSNATSNATSKHPNKLTYIELCKVVVNVSTAWKSAQEIARAVMRSPQHIRSKILPRMVKDGYLEMLDKENPNSPLQKYRATIEGKQLR